jgi:type IV secretion system protein VirD4
MMWVIVALWAVFVLWTGYGAVTNLSATLFPPHFSNPYMASMNTAAPLFALDVWACTSALILAFVVVNPRGWRNGKRMALGCTAFALMLGRLVSGFAAGLLGYAATVNPILAFAATPLLLWIAGAVTLITISFVALTVFGFFVGIPMLIANQVFEFERSLQIFQYKSNSLAGRIARLVMWLRNEQPPEALPDDSKGARFATLREIEALHVPDDPAAMAFGHIGKPLFIKTEKHVLIMASTRSGKGVTLIIPHLLRYKGSAFVLDPKGENAKATVRTRRTLNSKVHVLDPFGITGLPQARFNPLSRFTPENMEAESKALAAALFIIGAGERDHWNAAGQQLLAAIILYVYFSPAILPQHKDLPTVRKLLLGNLSDALNGMAELAVGDGLLGDLARSFKATPEREFGSIVSNAQRQTEILDNPFIKACLSATGPGEEVDFKAWKAGTMTVYLCLSAPKFPTFNRWLRLVLTSALDEMTDMLEPPKLPVCFMLDELATLGHLAPVENAVGLAAGYGIQLVTVFQDVAQMKDLYKGRWASFIGNAGVRALFSLDDFETADYWSKFIGGRLVENRSQQQDIYGFSKGENVGENMRPLMSPEQMMMHFASNNDPKKPDKMLLLVQGNHPIQTDRIAYFADQGLHGLWDDPRHPVSRARLPASSPPSPAPTSKPSPAMPANPAPVSAQSRTPAPAPASPPDAPATPPKTGGMFAGLFGGAAMTPSSNGWDTAETSPQAPVAPPAPPAAATPQLGPQYTRRGSFDAPASMANDPLPQPIIKLIPTPSRPNSGRGKPPKR